MIDRYTHIKRDREREKLSGRGRGIDGWIDSEIDRERKRTTNALTVGRVEGKRTKAAVTGDGDRAKARPGRNFDPHGHDGEAERRQRYEGEPKQARWQLRERGA